MGGQKLLWVLLGLSLISMIASANRVKSYDDVIEEEDFEDDEDDDCDPRCEKDCRQHEANCKSGVVRDACGCCECAQSEGEYCSLRVLPRYKKGTAQKVDPVNLKGRPLSSFLSLTPPHTFAPTTSTSSLVPTTNNLASSSSSASSSASSPTRAGFYTSNVDVDASRVTNKTPALKRKGQINKVNPKKQKAKKLPKFFKHGGIYSSKQNIIDKNNQIDDNPDGKKVFIDYDYDEDEEETVYFGTCGDYLECKPLFLSNKTPDVDEKITSNGEIESFRVASTDEETPKFLPSYNGESRQKGPAKTDGEKVQLLERLKRASGFKYAGFGDIGGETDFLNGKKRAHLKRKPAHNKYDAGKKKLTSLLFQEGDNNDADEKALDDENFLRLLSKYSSSSRTINNLAPQSRASSNTVGICMCRYAVTVCASDGKTYKNICHLKSASGSGQEGVGSNPVHVVKEGPCDPPVSGGSPPKVASVPLHAKNVTGGSAALSCEVTGDPIPFISWMKTNVNNETFELPGSDKNIMTLTRGGPEKHEATAWIQIMNLKKVHEGDYSCVASNKHGKAQATARLKVISKKKWRRHHKNE